MIIQIKK